jgi:hypothetical protein
VPRNVDLMHSLLTSHISLKHLTRSSDLFISAGMVPAVLNFVSWGVHYIRELENEVYLTVGGLNSTGINYRSARAEPEA